MMPIYAVIDTNVVVAALLTKNDDSATLSVLRAVLSGRIIPLFHADILDEYNEVLHRPGFHLCRSPYMADFIKEESRNDKK